MQCVHVLFLKTHQWESLMRINWGQNWHKLIGLLQGSPPSKSLILRVYLLIPPLLALLLLPLSLLPHHDACLLNLLYSTSIHPYTLWPKEKSTQLLGANIIPPDSKLTLLYYSQLVFLSLTHTVGHATPPILSNTHHVFCADYRMPLFDRHWTSLLSFNSIYNILNYCISI